MAHRGIQRGRRACLAALALLCLGGPGAMAQAPLVVRIGHVGPTSGWASVAGVESERAARLAVEQLNARSVRIGAVAARFELVAADDRDSAEGARRAAQALVAAGVHGVVGHLMSTSAIAAAPVYAQAGIAQISTQATNPALTRMGLKTTFRLVADDAQIAHVLARHVVGDLRRARVAALDNGSMYGRAMVELFSQAATAAGGRVVVAQRVDPLAVDFADFIAAAAAQQADAVFFGGWDTQAGRLLGQMNARGLDALFVAGDGPCTLDMVSFYANGRARDGQVLCVLPGGTGDVGVAPGFIADYERRYGRPPFYGALAYDAVMLIADAMVRAGSAEPAQYLPQLAATRDYAGASGRITFDARGDLVWPVLGLFTYRDEALQLVRLVR